MNNIVNQKSLVEIILQKVKKYLQINKTHKLN